MPDKIVPNTTNPEEYGSGLAYKLAKERFEPFSVVQHFERCRCSGAQYRVIQGKKELIIPFLARKYVVNMDEHGMLPDRPENLREAILVLHYYLGVRDIAPGERQVTYQELPGGNVYYDVFTKRTISPLLRSFGENTRHFLILAEEQGGTILSESPATVTFQAFSRIPITFTIWEKDDEFPASGTILFDSGITGHISLEDITILCETISWSLVKSSGQ